MPLDKTDIHKILVVKLRNIGDVLLTSPVFANLREHFPSARICAFVNRGTEAMLTDNPNIDKLYVYDRDLKKAPFLQRSVAELSLMKRVRSEGFDMVLNLTEGDRGALVALASGAKIKVGVDSRGRGFCGKNRIFTHLLPPPDREAHAVDQNLAALILLGLEVRHKKVEFHFPEDVRAGMTARLAANDLKPYGFYHAHVTSRWMFKTLPPEKMAALLDFMTAETGLPAVLEAAPVEKELSYLEQVLASCRFPHINLGDVPLKDLGALSAMSSFFIGVDSAPMHIAAAVGVPVLGLFGPLPAPNWGPWDNRLMVNPYRALRGIQSTGLNMVLQAGDPCVPCSRDGCHGSKRSNCLDFPEAELLAAVREFLAMICYDRQ